MKRGPPPTEWVGGGNDPGRPSGRPGEPGRSRLTPVADAAADRAGLVDFDRLTLQEGVDGIPQVLLGDPVLVLAVVHRAGVADHAILVDDDELRGIGRPVGLADRLAIIVAVDEGI